MFLHTEELWNHDACALLYLKFRWRVVFAWNLLRRWGTHSQEKRYVLHFVCVCARYWLFKSSLKPFGLRRPLRRQQYGLEENSSALRIWRVRLQNKCLFSWCWDGYTEFTIVGVEEFGCKVSLMAYKQEAYPFGFPSALLQSAGFGSLEDNLRRDAQFYWLSPTLLAPRSA